MPCRQRNEPLMSVDNLIANKDLINAHVKLVRTDQTQGWPSFGELALQIGVPWRYAGCGDGRTLLFVNLQTNVPAQIFRNELLGACFAVSVTADA